MIDFEIKDYTKEILALEEKAVKKALTTIGITLRDDTSQAQEMPTDTGLLKNSIAFALSGESFQPSSYSGRQKEEGVENSGSYSGITIGEKDERAVYVGTNVKYAPYIHYGHIYLNGHPPYPAHPFLKNTIERDRDKIKKAFEEALGKND